MKPRTSLFSFFLFLWTLQSLFPKQRSNTKTYFSYHSPLSILMKSLVSSCLNKTRGWERDKSIHFRSSHKSLLWGKRKSHTYSHTVMRVHLAKAIIMTNIHCVQNFLLWSNMQTKELKKLWEMAGFKTNFFFLKYFKQRQDWKRLHSLFCTLFSHILWLVLHTYSFLKYNLSSQCIFCQQK